MKEEDSLKQFFSVVTSVTSTLEVL